MLPLNASYKLPQTNRNAGKMHNESEQFFTHENITHQQSAFFVTHQRLTPHRLKYHMCGKKDYS